MLLKFYKLSTLPGGTLESNAFYYIENGTVAESYITNTLGVPRSIGNTAMINALINTAITEALAAANSMEIVNDIAARDALVLDKNCIVLVLNASADPTVGSGSATYAHNNADDSWTKIAEYESMDVIVDWTNIANAPTSSVAQIDNAVSQAHSHTNKSDLDKIGNDGNGNMIYNGNAIITSWSATDW